MISGRNEITGVFEADPGRYRGTPGDENVYHDL